MQLTPDQWNICAEGTGPLHDRPARGIAAFTMVEIALCLGIIAIALVAIIGVMPTGLKVQKDNREDTIINQDGTLLLNAIRNGARGLDYLTNFVDVITITSVSPSAVTVTNYVYGNRNVSGLGPVISRNMTNGAMIIGLLSRPKYQFLNPPDGPITNHVTARIRAISGSAVDKSQVVVNNEFAFGYEVTSEIVPLSPYPPSTFNTNRLTPAEIAVRTNLALIARNQAANFYELRLTLQGPVVRKGDRAEVFGTPRTFRTLINGFPLITNVAGADLFFFQPSTFAQVKP